MHDVIHAAIATERVRDRVEYGDNRRAARRAKRERVQAEATPQAEPQVQLKRRGGRVAAILRLRPWVM
jgi:hypothetical protein